MKKETIPFGKPMLGEEEFEAVRRVLESGRLVHGPATIAFEEVFAKRIGADYAIAVGSCTAGLHLSLIAGGIGPGDRVAVPAMTHVATSHVIEHCGATPVFVDVEPDSGNISASGIDAAAGDGPLKGIMVVHYLGLPCEMDEINALAKQNGAFVVEDCALAVDATYGDRKAGTFGMTGCFSFYPVKHLTTIEGGIVTTSDPHVAAHIMQRRSFGYDKALDQRAIPGHYDVSALGYNYRMSEVEAAVGLEQLKRLDGFQKSRTEHHRRLSSALSDVGELTIFPATRGKAKSSHYCFNIVLPADGSVDRSRMIEELNGRGIGTSIHYPGAVPLFTYYREKYGYKPGQFPVSEWLSGQTISLPVGPHLPDDGPERIAAAVREALASVR